MKEIKESIPDVYCPKCGTKCNVETRLQHYERRSGRRVVYAMATCPNATGGLRRLLEYIFDDVWHDVRDVLNDLYYQEEK